MANMARIESVRGGESHIESQVYSLFPQCRTGSQSSRGTRYRRTRRAVSCRNCLDILRWAQTSAIEDNEQFDIRAENERIHNAAAIDGMAAEMVERVKTLTGTAHMHATLIAVGPDAADAFSELTHAAVQNPLDSPVMASETVGTALPIEACTADANGSPIYAGDAVQFVAYGLIARVGVIARIDGPYAYVRYIGANGTPVRERGIDLLGGGRVPLFKTYSPRSLADGMAVETALEWAESAWRTPLPESYYSEEHVGYLEGAASALLKAGEIAARAAHIGLVCKAPYVLCEFTSLYAATVRQEGMAAVRRARHIREAMSGAVAAEDRRARLGK